MLIKKKITIFSDGSSVFNVLRGFDTSKSKKKFLRNDLLKTADSQKVSYQQPFLKKYNAKTYQKDSGV